MDWTYITVPNASLASYGRMDKVYYFQVDWQKICMEKKTQRNLFKLNTIMQDKKILYNKMKTSP